MAQTKDTQGKATAMSTQRLGLIHSARRGVDVEELIKRLIANAAADASTSYYAILRMHLACHEDTGPMGRCPEERARER